MLLEQVHIHISLGRPYGASDVPQSGRGQIEDGLAVDERADHRQNAKALAVRQGVDEEVQRPALMRPYETSMGTLMPTACARPPQRRAASERYIARHLQRCHLPISIARW